MSPSEFAAPAITPWRVLAVIVMLSVTLFWMLFQFGVSVYEPAPPDDWSE